MSTLQVGQINSPTYNASAVSAGVVTADAVTVTGNVSAGRGTTTNEYQFIERIPLQSQAMANTSNISGYSSIRITIENVQGANNESDLWLQVSADGGTIYANSNSYFGQYTYLAGVTAQNGVTGDSGTGHRLTRWGISNLANSGGCSGILDVLSNKSGTDNRFQTILHYRSGEIGASGPWNYLHRGAGRIFRDTKITNYRFMMTNNDIFANGTLTIEGLPG